MMNIYRLHSNPNELKQVNLEKVLHSKGVRNNKIDGNLSLSNTPITSLPDNLKVSGDLWLTDTPITSLPDNLTVGGNLYLGGAPITSLPDNLTVGGTLNLNGTQYLDKNNLPSSLVVKGDIIK